MGFWPCEGGRLELSGVFGGAESLASSSPTCGQGADLLGLRYDLLVLDQDQGDQFIAGEIGEGCAVHASP